MLKRRAGRSIAAAIVLSIVLADGLGPAVAGQFRSPSCQADRPELQHDGVQRLRHARDAHPSRVQPRRARARAVWSRRTRAAAAPCHMRGVRR